MATLERTPVRSRPEDSLRQELLERLAHDLRSPLSAVSTASLLLREHRLNGQQRSQQLRLIDAACHRMSRVMEDMLDLARIDAGAFPLRFAAVSTTSLFEGLDRDVGWLAREAGVQLVPMLAGEPMRHVWVDHRQTARALQAVVQHAIQRTHAGGTVQVRSAERGRGFGVDVLHEGRTLGSAEREHLFDWSWSLPPTERSRAGHPSLALARRILALQGGFIEAVNQKTGPAFQISLPTA